MKKFLYGTTALFAAGLIAGQASASEPIKLSLGGFMNQWVGWADNEKVSRSQNNLNASERKYNKFDVQSDSKVYVSGTTKLDNGITIGATFYIQGDTNNANAASAGNRAVDNSYMTLTSDTLGTFYLGGQVDAGELIYIPAPDVGMGIDGENAYWQNWIMSPGANTAMTFSANTYFNPGDKAAKVTYISPAWHGFAIGGSWTPNNGTATVASETNNIGNGISNKAAGASQSFSGGGAYSNKYGDLSVGFQAAYGRLGSGFAGYPLDAYQSGAKLAYEYAGQTFTLAGGWANYGNRSTTSRVRDQPGLGITLNGNVFDAGVSYVTGPWGASFSALQSRMEGSRAVRGDDVVTVYMASGSYNMGPGVDLKLSIFNVNYSDEANNGRATNNNNGWGVATGLCLTF